MKSNRYVYCLLLVLLASTLSVFAVQVNLDFYADGQLIHSHKVESDAEYTLSDYVKTDTVVSCRNWDFVGWTLNSPTEGIVNVSPCLVETVTPSANMNFYAVYGMNNGNKEYRFIKISGTQQDLVNGDYIITYEDDDNNNYALGMTEYLYSSANSKNRYAINSTRITEISCDYTEIYGSQPDSLIWYYTKYSDEYFYYGTLQNAGNDNYLYPDSTQTGSRSGYTDNFNVLKNSAGSVYVYYYDEWDKFGIFTYPSQNIFNNLLFTSGQFISLHTSGWYPILNLFKKTEVDSYDYTFYPNCSNWSTYLDAGLGTIGETSDHTLTITEETPGAAITLPSATEGNEFSCGDWDFYGWHRDTPVETTTKNIPTVYTGSGYIISHDGEQLYATYSRTENTPHYEQISSLSELSNGDICLIVYTGNSYAVTYNNSQRSWSGTSVSAKDGVINESGLSANIKWTYNSENNYFYCGTNNTTYRLAYDGAEKEAYNLVEQGSSNFKLQNKGYSNYRVRWSGSSFSESTTDSQNTYRIYVRRETITTYSSFPHCRPYSVTLHAGSGTIDIDGNPETTELTESEAGEGVVLPDAIPGCDRQGWSFVGWVEKNPVGSVRKTDFTGEDGLIGTSSYVPTRSGTELYAVYARLSDYYRIVNYPDNMVVGDNYIMTYYARISGDDDNVWDVELSSEVVSTNYLSGVPMEAPQDADGYYMVATDSAVIWKLGGSTDAWTFQNMENNSYLRSNSSGYMWTNGTPSAYTITRPDDDLNLSIKENSTNKYLYFDGSKFLVNNTEHNACFLYRQMKEYATYPHCELFTVHFDGCGGTAGDDYLTETEVDGGITLPFAFAKNDCSRENWEFIGWAESPIDSETDVLPFDLLSPGMHFTPTKNDATLYAVYGQKQNSYAKITSLSDMRLGIGYIIATDGNRALKAAIKNTDYADYVTVSPSNDIIVLNDANAIEWRIQGAHNEYEFFNVNDSLYLDLRTAGKAHLDNAANDNFRVSGASGAYNVRSNRSIAAGTTGKKFLHFDATNNRFDSETTENASTINFYQRQAFYNSYPYCAEPIEALRWTDDNHVILESYVLSDKPRLSGGIGEAAFYEDEGVFCLEYNPAVLQPGVNAAVSWGGKDASLHIPYLVTSNANASALGAAYCPTCDYVVFSGDTLTVDADKTVHDITVYEGGVLQVADDVTLSMHSLILRRDDESAAPQVLFGNENSVIDLQFNEIYYDIRIDEERYYWFSLPFNASTQKISYANISANGKDAVYRTDYFVKYYNGAQRAADADNSRQAKTYWTHVADKKDDAVLKAGQGYEIGIANQKNEFFNGQDYTHKKRVIRFTMLPDDARWNTQEIGSSKLTDIEPSTCWHPLNAVHAGWNLIGNPYLHNYTTGTMDGNSGLLNGSWVKEMNGQGIWTGYYVRDDETTSVPYLTVYDPATRTYSQHLAANYTLKPFDAVFVQINEGSQINFSAAEPMHVNRIPAYRRAAAEEAPLYTGITLSGNDCFDRTGIVLADKFTPEYEIAGDLSKMLNAASLNLYTLNAYNQELAFNAMSDDDAKQPVPVGVTIPSAGVYTFAFDAEQYDALDLDELILIDYQENTETNLLFSEYEYYAAQGTQNNRFALLVRRAKSHQDISTDMENINADESCKFIRDGQLYILKDNKLYNALGVRL